MYLIIIKILVSILIVILLSLLAEYSSPQIAGFFSAFPTGSAIALFFIGVEISHTFAGTSAVYNIIGLIAMQSFLLGYYLFSKLTKKIAKISIFIASIGGFLFYLIVIFILKQIQFTKITSVIISFIFILI
ncbi:MAG: hypothetical protein MJB14_05375, partial [Spirochaetes bacterium]|nr:hypothetical protein [Spirochaetota bacterium]